MSILLILKSVMSAAPETQAFAIDLGDDIAIKRRLRCDQVLQSVNDFAKENPRVMMNIEARDIPFAGGAIHLIIFCSPLLDLDDVPKHQDMILPPLRDFNPVLIGEDMLQKISNLKSHELKNELPKIENEIFRVQRERKMLLSACENATPNASSSKPQIKI